MLLEAIARVERGDSRRIVVAKLDRFGRSLLDGLAAIERITSAGGTFVSVADGLDFSSDTGRLVLRIMLSMAEWELDRVRSNWAVAQARALARGVQIGPAPVGYRRDREGRLVVDRTLGPVVTDLFRRRAEGGSIAALCGHLEAGGVKRPSGGTAWPSSSVHSIFRSRVYLGEVRHGQHVNRSAHPLLADPGHLAASAAPEPTLAAARHAARTAARDPSLRRLPQGADDVRGRGAGRRASGASTAALASSAPGAVPHRP